ncbi:glycine cleavage system aminomethyltransferase GcvT [Bacteroidia bacterium]|nr:glycine cleavage system aminomethyltransferase GcvT [Bacteroidia bacterium]
MSTDTSALKRIALHDKHVSLGAKMVPFAGYEMPLQYEGLTPEHHAVRNSIGVFDVSHMGEFGVKGKDAEALVAWICSNNISNVVDMQAQYNCMPNEDGGIVDDLIVYRWSSTEYTLVVNASNIAKDWDWIMKQKEAKGFDCQIENQSDDISLFAVQGPNATKALQKLTDVDLDAIKFYHFDAGALGGSNDVVISNTGYTGSGGFEVYVWNKDANMVWDAIMDAAKDYDLVPCGLAARDTLRLEKGYCLYGHEINDTTSPIEAGLGWITKFEEPFVNQEYHQNLKTNGVSRKLVGFEMIDRGIPRQDYDIVDSQGNKIGEVCSGTQSPSLGYAIGTGYVTPEYAKSGSEIYIAVRKKQLKAKVVKMPFLK